MLLINLLLALAFTYQYEMAFEYPINDTPTYFFKPSYNGRYFAYTTWVRSDGLNAQNSIYDSETGEVLLIPGVFDPIFMLNTTSILMPNSSPQGYAFYNLSDLIQNKREASSIYIDTDITGVYQSIARLKTEGNTITYRMISENGALRNYKDFAVNFDDKGHMIAVEPVSSVQPLCENFRFSLPMISKEGLRFSGLDQADGKTKIFTLNGASQCNVITNLNKVTGKVGFAYNERYIAYHKFSRHVRGEHIDLPPTNVSANIYLYDLVTKTEYKLTDYSDGNAMYPEFIENDDIVYVYHPNDRSQKVKFVRLKRVADTEPNIP